jgi:hypothetical protein
MIDARTAAQLPPLDVFARLGPSYSHDPVGFRFVDQSAIVAALNLAFATKALRSLCENRSIAERQLGPKSAERLRRRLADLRAAESLGDILASGLLETFSSETNELSFDLLGFKLVLRINHHALPVDDLGEVEWKRVSRVKVMNIEEPS